MSFTSVRRRAAALLLAGCLALAAAGCSAGGGDTAAPTPEPATAPTEAPAEPTSEPAPAPAEPAITAVNVDPSRVCRRISSAAWTFPACRRSLPAVLCIMILTATPSPT